jgi:hypothetical protein
MAFLLCISKVLVQFHYFQHYDLTEHLCAVHHGTHNLTTFKNSVHHIYLREKRNDRIKAMQTKILPVMLAYDRWHIFTVKLSKANITVQIGHMACVCT